MAQDHAAKSYPPAWHSSQAPRLLIVDDSPADLSLLVEMMVNRRMRINIAFDGEDGYNKAVLQCPDLILLDLVMPRMDGFASCRLLKSHERTRYIPIIFLSAANEVDKRVEGLTLGAVDFIGKPFEEEEVIARVEVHLNLARQRLENLADSLPTEDFGQEQLGELPRRDQVLLRAAMQHLRLNLREPPTLTAISRQLGCNVKRLNHAFQEAMGMTALAWLREERLRQARSLLLITETPVASIALHLGFSSQANFAKAFRERFGCSARELRAELQRLALQGDSPNPP
jgi:DNA-binding response OmpR family regulator